MRLILASALASLMASAASAAPPKSFHIDTKVGRSNVQISVVLHPQVDRCAPAQLDAIKRQALSFGQDYIRARLSALTRKSGTDASDDSQFFGVSYLAGCPADGSAWLAFPVEGKNKSVSRFEPGKGWSKMAPI